MIRRLIPPLLIVLLLGAPRAEAAYKLYLTVTTQRDIDELWQYTNDGSGWEAELEFLDLMAWKCHNPDGTPADYQGYYSILVDPLHPPGTEPSPYVDTHYLAYDQLHTNCFAGNPVPAEYPTTTAYFAVRMNHMGPEWTLIREGMIIFGPDPVNSLFHQTYLGPDLLFYKVYPYAFKDPWLVDYGYGPAPWEIDEKGYMFPIVMDPQPDNYVMVWQDLDHDGYGDPEKPYAFNETEEIDWTVWATNDGDCDDGNSSINPGATEKCNLYWDDDCDDQVDEGVAPDCAGKVCGDDGCFGTCGTCPLGQACQDGQCVVACLGYEAPAGTDCGGIDFLGCCDEDDTLHWCQEGLLYCFPCPGGGCGWKDADWGYDCSTDGGEDPSGAHPKLCGACAPDCAGKACGPDGCGGSCGGCPSPLQCSAGACVCVPQCDGKECASDGCGGSCGVCEGGDLCQDGLCVAPPCVPDCMDKSCGGDGCGGFCGACDDEQICVGGACVAPIDCAAVFTCVLAMLEDPDGEPALCLAYATPETVAASDAVWLCLQDLCGASDLDPECLQDAVEGECLEPYRACVPCQPDCDGKSCGPDGCGGTCGECQPWDVCSDAGLCATRRTPEEDTVTPRGSDTSLPGDTGSPSDTAGQRVEPGPKKAGAGGCASSRAPHGPGGAIVMFLGLLLLIRRARGLAR